jgi:hypothetical protein
MGEDFGEDVLVLRKSRKVTLHVPSNGMGSLSIRIETKGKKGDDEVEERELGQGRSSAR